MRDATAIRRLDTASRPPNHPLGWIMFGGGRRGEVLRRLLHLRACFLHGEGGVQARHLPPHVPPHVQSARHFRLPGAGPSPSVQQPAASGKHGGGVPTQCSRFVQRPARHWPGTSTRASDGSAYTIQGEFRTNTSNARRCSDQPLLPEFFEK